MKFYQWCFNAFKKHMLRTNLGVLTYTLRRTDDKEKIHDQWVASVKTQGYKDKEEIKENLTLSQNEDDEVLLTGPDSDEDEDSLEKVDNQEEKKTIKIKIGKGSKPKKRIYPAPIKG